MCEKGAFILGLFYAHGIANYEQSSLNAVIHNEMASALGCEEALSIRRLAGHREELYKVAQPSLSSCPQGFTAVHWALKDDPKARKQKKDMVQFYELWKTGTPDVLLLVGRVFFYGIGGVAQICKVASLIHLIY